MTMVSDGDDGLTDDFDPQRGEAGFDNSVEALVPVLVDRCGTTLSAVDLGPMESWSDANYARLLSSLRTDFVPSSLRKLQLGEVDLALCASTALARLVPHLQELDLLGSRIEGILDVLAALESCTVLYDLQISGTSAAADPRSAAVLFGAISRAPCRLTTLIVGADCMLTDDVDLARSLLRLARSHQVESLRELSLIDLEHTSASPALLGAVALLLSRCVALREVALARGGLDTETSVATVCRALAFSKAPLMHVSLAGNAGGSIASLAPLTQEAPRLAARMQGFYVGFAAGSAEQEHLERTFPLLTDSVMENLYDESDGTSARRHVRLSVVNTSVHLTRRRRLRRVPSRATARGAGRRIARGVAAVARVGLGLDAPGDVARIGRFGSNDDQRYVLAPWTRS